MSNAQIMAAASFNRFVKLTNDQDTIDLSIIGEGAVVEDESKWGTRKQAWFPVVTLEGFKILACPVIQGVCIIDCWDMYYRKVNYYTRHGKAGSPKTHYTHGATKAKPGWEEQAIERWKGEEAAFLKEFEARVDKATSSDIPF